MKAQKRKVFSFSNAGTVVAVELGTARKIGQIVRCSTLAKVCLFPADEVGRDLAKSYQWFVT